MRVFEVLNWIGLISLIASACCVALITLRKSVWFGPPESLTKSLKRFDKKLAKLSGLLLIIGVLFFILAALT